MECREGQLPDSSENDSILTVSTSGVTSNREPQIPGDPGAETACDSSTEIAGEQGTRIPGDHGAPTDADSTAQAAAQTPGNLLERKDMSVRRKELPYELENQFILRLPMEQACTVRNLMRSGSVISKDKLKIDLSSDGRNALVQVEDVSLAAKLVDLPCVIGSLKTYDKKTFYKTADISQMLVCKPVDLRSSPEEPVTSDVQAMSKDEKEKQKKYVWKHGITPPLKNVRKKRFRKTTKKPNDFKQMEEISFTECTDSPDVEKDVKRLLSSDAEAVCARWEVITEGETKEIESQGSIPGFEIAPGMSGYNQGHISEYDMLRETFSDSSSNNDDNEEEDDNDEDEDDDDEDEDEDDEEEDDYEEDSEEELERELQAKFMASGQYEAKDGASSVVSEIQKQIHYIEKRLHRIQKKAQRQKTLIMKVENLMLKNHFQSVLEKLTLEENQKTEQLVSLQEQLKYFLEK
ncbi:PREDICTED: transcription initiation factor TFIID subunit 7-like [Propithecus coquereli]|uniref:transcription initiation factor TFIID subunit 7-like n=1 Tax=Propithecus coquereli TaxID=379532 RepID=UPI00063FD203|nr:PREDICTED: transcription initiation factor TFIID subunit 7-like [Propithecus coquereli]